MDSRFVYSNAFKISIGMKSISPVNNGLCYYMLYCVYNYAILLTRFDMILMMMLKLMMVSISIHNYIYNNYNNSNKER